MERAKVLLKAKAAEVVSEAVRVFAELKRRVRAD